MCMLFTWKAHCIDVCVSVFRMRVSVPHVNVNVPNKRKERQNEMSASTFMSESVHGIRTLKISAVKRERICIYEREREDLARNGNLATMKSAPHVVLSAHIYTLHAFTVKDLKSTHKKLDSMHFQRS